MSDDNNPLSNKPWYKDTPIVCAMAGVGAVLIIIGTTYFVAPKPMEKLQMQPNNPPVVSSEMQEPATPLAVSETAYPFYTKEEEEGLAKLERMKNVIHRELDKPNNQHAIAQAEHDLETAPNANPETEQVIEEVTETSEPELKTEEKPKTIGTITIKRGNMTFTYDVVEGDEIQLSN